MANRLTKAPTAIYIAEVAAIPPVPAFCVTETVVTGYTREPQKGGVANYVPNRTASKRYGTDGNGNIWVIETQSGGAASSLGSVLTPRTQDIVTCYPAVAGRPAVPARTDYSANAGWTGGARSRLPIPTFGEFSATMLATVVATQLGFARRPYNHVYSDMSHSLVARAGTWTVVEQGVTKVTGPLPAQARITLRRVGSRVTYLANGEELYQSQVPLAGEVFGAALMYSLADGVDAPSVTPLGQMISFYGTTPRWQMLAADAPVAGVRGEIPGLVLTAQLSPIYGVSQFSGTMPRIALLATDRPVIVARGTIPAPRLRASLGFLERVPNQLLALVPPPVVGMNLRSGGLLTVKAALPNLPGLVSDRSVSLVSSSLNIGAVLFTAEPYMAPGEIDGMDLVIAADSSQLDAALILVAIDTLGVSSTASLTLVLELSTLDALRVADASSFGQLVEMLAMDKLAVFSSASTARHQAIQYAVNAITGAPTTYEGFDFSRFATVDGVTYGVRPDGLYRIGGTTDNGELISALIDFGTSDFADAHVKRVETAYLGIRTDGQTYLRVRADVGGDKIYRLRGEGNVRRSMLAKGLAARNWSVTLEVVDASYAEVDSLELLVGATQRRGFGTRTR